MSMRENLYRKVAKEYGVTPKEVRQEIQHCITAAYTDPLNQNEIKKPTRSGCRARQHTHTGRIPPVYGRQCKHRKIHKKMSKQHSEFADSRFRVLLFERRFLWLRNGKTISELAETTSRPGHTVAGTVAAIPDNGGPLL